MREFIGDLSDFISNPSENFIMKIGIFFYKIILKICNCLRLDRIPLIDPENPIKLGINSIIAAYNLFYLYIMSMEVFFEAELGET